MKRRRLERNLTQEVFAKRAGIGYDAYRLKPNFVSLAGKLEVSRNSLDEYLTFMEDAGLISRLRDQAIGEPKNIMAISFHDAPTMFTTFPEKPPMMPFLIVPII